MTDRRWNSQKQEWEYPVIDHIDGNPRNNDLANLMAVWPADNAPRRDVPPEQFQPRVGQPSGAFGWPVVSGPKK